jgi:hypothetical protein
LSEQSWIVGKRKKCGYTIGTVISDVLVNAINHSHGRSEFITIHLKSWSLLLDVTERALRACGGSAELWQARMMALERSHASFDKVEAVLEVILYFCMVDYTNIRIDGYRIGDNHHTRELSTTSFILL